MSSSAIAEVLPGAGAVFKILKRAGVFERAWDWVSRTAAAEVIVLGASGAGKSSFLNQISGKDPHIGRLERTTHPAVVTGKLENIYFKLHDTPGQPDPIYREKRLEAVRRASRHEIGIINVVSYGYHEETVPTSRAVDGSTAKAKDDFLTERRKLENKLIGEWVDILCGQGGSAAWMITLVTKADLWWADAPDQPVMQHYQSGEYFKRLSGAQLISHDVLPYSSHNQKFYNAVPMSGHYGDQRKLDDHNRLIRKMVSNERVVR